MNVLKKKSLLALIGITSAAVVGGFAGCSSSSSDGTLAGTDGGTVGNDGSTGGDGSAGGDGGTGGDSGGPTATSTGYVNFTQFNIANAYSNNGSAQFYVLPAGFDLQCAGYGTATAPTATTAGCAIKVCSDPIVSDGGTTANDGGTVISPNTGDITLKSAADTTGVVLTAKSDGTYTPATSVTQWWAPADGTIEVKSNGSSSSIPAFDDLTLIGPGDVTSPMFNSTNIGTPVATPISFDRGTALAVTYSGGTAGTKFNVTLSTTSTAKKSIITCDFDAANGTESIAAADLGNLEKADGTAITGAFSAQARYVKATTAGDFNFNVTLGATSHAGTFTNSN